VAELTVYGVDADGMIRSSSATYATARTGSGTLTLNPEGTGLYSGQLYSSGTYYLDESFFAFDTSGLPDDAIIQTVVLSLWGISSSTLNDRVHEVRAYDWGDTVTTGDWISGADLGSSTLVASLADEDFAYETYAAFTSEAAFLTAINKTGVTRLVMASSRLRLGTAPTGLERESWAGGEATDPPKLVITYTVPIAHEGSVTFHGTGSFQSAAQCNYSGSVTFHGAGRFTAAAEGTPTLDFSRYDAYVEDDEGTFGVIYYEDEGARKSTLSKELTPTRQDTGQNPFEIRPESGDIFSQGDFSRGAGQLYFHHQGQDSKKFLRSEGFDILEPGLLKHLHATAAAYADVNVGKLVSIGGYPFVISGYDVKKGNGSWPGSWTTEDPEVAETPGTVYDLASSGSVGYAALGANGIHQRSSGGTWSHYNAAEAKRLLWSKGRLMAASDTMMYEVVAGGAAPTPIETLSAGWTFESIFEAGAFIYACAINTADNESKIHIYAPNTDNTAIEKRGEQGFPLGQLVRSGCGYLNIILLGAGKKNTSAGYDPVLYRAIPDDDGFLEYIKVAEEVGSGSADCSVKAFVPLGESIVFGWSTGSGCAMGAARGGLGIYHVATGAFAAHLRGSTNANGVSGILSYGGRLVFALTGVGLYYEDTANLISEATLITSVADWNNAGLKLWHRHEITHAPLVADTRVKLYYATEIPVAATTWSEIFSSSTTSSTGASARTSDLSSRLFALKVVSYSDTGQDYAPELVSFGVYSYPAPSVPEFTLQRFIRLSDIDRKDMQAEEIRQDASALFQRLLGNAYTFVKVYEPGIIWNARIERVGGPEVVLPPFDPLGDESGDFYVVQLVMTGTL